MLTEILTVGTISWMCILSPPMFVGVMAVTYFGMKLLLLFLFQLINLITTKW